MLPHSQQNRDREAAEDTGMNQIIADAIAKSIIRQMKDSGHALWIDPETHAAQHQFISEMIEERKDRLARRKRIEEKIAGSFILSGLLLLVGLIGAGALEWLRKHQ